MAMRESESNQKFVRARSVLAIAIVVFAKRNSPMRKFVEIERAPKKSVALLHPAGLSPKIFIPKAIRYFPSGGCSRFVTGAIVSQSRAART